MITGFFGMLTLILGWCLFELNKQLDIAKSSLKRYEFLSTQEGFQKKLALGIISKREEPEFLSKKQSEFSDKYKKLCKKEEINDFLDSDICAKRKKISELEVLKNKLSIEIKKLQKEVDFLSEESYVQSFGFYQSKYDFIGVGNYASQLKNIKAKQRVEIRQNRAINCRSELIFR